MGEKHKSCLYVESFILRDFFKQLNLSISSAYEKYGFCNGVVCVLFRPLEGTIRVEKH